MGNAVLEKMDLTQKELYLIERLRPGIYSEQFNVALTNLGLENHHFDRKIGRAHV